MDKKTRQPRPRQATLLNRFEGLSWEKLLEAAPKKLELGDPALDLDAMTREQLDELNAKEDREEAKWESGLARMVRGGEISIEAAITCASLNAAQAARKDWIRDDSWRRRQEEQRREQRLSELKAKSPLPRCRRIVDGAECGMLLGTVSGSDEKVCIRCDHARALTSEGSAA